MYEISAVEIILSAIGVQQYTSTLESYLPLRDIIILALDEMSNEEMLPYFV